MRMKKIWITLAATLLGMALHAQDYSPYQKKIFILHQDTLRYRILYPKQYDLHKKYPLVVFLHGSGERGDDNEKQLSHGGDLFLQDSNREKFPALVVFPQCPADSAWAAFQVYQGSDSLRHFRFSLHTPPGTAMRLTVKLIGELVAGGQVDTKRIYLGGLSLGGFGTFDMLWRYPGLFAAAFPICGAGNPAAVKLYNRRTAVWIFHGAKDPVVPYVNSKQMYAAMRKRGMQVKYTLYPDAEHDSWDSAFSEKDLLPWLFSKHL